MKKGPYTVLSSKIAYKNPWIKVTEDKVIRPDGKEGMFGVVDYDQGVSVVAFDTQMHIYLVNEYYYALETYKYQLPSGGIDEKETTLIAAKRELLEETGLTAKRWKELGYVDPLTMIIKSPAYLFMAFDVTKKQEQEEGMIVKKVPFKKAYEMVLRNEITHAPSCVAILKAKIYLEKKKLI